MTVLLFQLPMGIPPSDKPSLAAPIAAHMNSSSDMMYAIMCVNTKSTPLRNPTSSKFSVTQSKMFVAMKMQPPQPRPSRVLFIEGMPIPPLPNSNRLPERNLGERHARGNYCMTSPVSQETTQEKQHFKESVPSNIHSYEHEQEICLEVNEEWRRRMAATLKRKKKEKKEYHKRNSR